MLFLILRLILDKDFRFDKGSIQNIYVENFYQLDSLGNDNG